MKKIVTASTLACFCIGWCIAGCAPSIDEVPVALLERPGRVVFEDRFEREELGAAWLDTGGGYRLVAGELRAAGARNRPLWLQRKLPRDVRVGFLARSSGPDVDIKFELFGDGRSRAERASYTATSYVLILGGWRNSRSIIARLDEHGRDRVERTAPAPAAGRTYRFAVVRVGARLSWFVDGAPFLSLEDPEPLAGPGHEHFAFNDWKSEVFFDDLKIEAL